MVQIEEPLVSGVSVPLANVPAGEKKLYESRAFGITSYQLCPYRPVYDERLIEASNYRR